MNRDNTRIEVGNMILIAGNGRNVGKTWLSCRIIEHLSKSHRVTALKFSPHFHSVQEEDILLRDKDFIITQESQINHKDSSLMLQAGARDVFFIMAVQENLQKAFTALQPHLPHSPIVCESGGLHEIVEPGLFIFVNQPGKALVKKQHLQYSPLIIINNGREINFDIKRIHFVQNKIQLHPLSDC